MKRAFLLLLSITPLVAHHSPAAEDDINHPVAIEGVVKEVRWMNPHASILIDVTDAAGKVSVWEVAMGSPNRMVRDGWKQDDLKAGDRVKVEVWPSKSGMHLGDAKTLTLSAGRTFTGKPTWGPGGNGQ